MSPFTGTFIAQEDVNFLLGVLCTSAHKWEFIGMALGFLDGELKNISSSSPTAGVQRHLKEMLSQWAHWPTKTHPDPPTLERLCDALRSQLVGLGNVADHVYKQKSCLQSQNKND